MVLIGNARQAMSEGKSGPVETRLTGPAATALFSRSFVCLSVCLRVLKDETEVRCLVLVSHRVHVLSLFTVIV